MYFNLFRQQWHAHLTLEADASAITHYVKIIFQQFEILYVLPGKITLFLHLFSHVQLSLSGAVRMADTQWENRQHLELYSCHTVERRGSFSHPCQCNNHQFSSLVAGCSPPGPAVFDTIYLLYWSISFLIINLTFKKKMSSNNKYVKWQHG